MKLTNLTDEELRQISLIKNRRGCATAEALRAQRILMERSNSFYACGSNSNYSGCGDTAWGNYVR